MSTDIISSVCKKFNCSNPRGALSCDPLLSSYELLPLCDLLGSLRVDKTLDRRRKIFFAKSEALCCQTDLVDHLTKGWIAEAQRLQCIRVSHPVLASLVRHSKHIVHTDVRVM